MPGGRAIVAVGVAVRPEDYPRLGPLLAALDAELAATRRVTDQGWLPRTRQVGLTGHSVAPDFYMAVGLSGKANHMIGSRSARTVVAVNTDPAAPVFEWADLGIVADWRDAIPLLASAINDVLSKIDRTRLPRNDVAGVR
jgi:electron transfer flavoprotein alpha subunit